MTPAIGRFLSGTAACLAGATLVGCGSASVGARTSVQASPTSSTSTPMTGIFGSNPIQSVAVHDACKAQLAAMSTAVEAYVAVNGTDPSTFGALVTAGLLHGDAHINAATGRTVTFTAAPGSYVLTLGGASGVAGTIDGKPC